MTRCQLVEICGVRSGDKGDISDLSLFADSDEMYEILCQQVTADRVKSHVGSLVNGDVVRYEAPNVLALKFVMYEALGGGAGSSLRSDTQGKTYGLSLLRMWVDVPDEILVRSRRPRPPADASADHDDEV